MIRKGDFKTIEDALEFIKENPSFSGIISLKLQINKDKLPTFFIGSLRDYKGIDYLDISLEVKEGHILSSEIKQIHKEK